MRNYSEVTYDHLAQGDRRKADRRQQSLDRRGVLRWDPRMKERRTGADRRHVRAAARTGI